MEAAAELRCVLEGKPCGGVCHVDFPVQGEEDFVPIIKRTVCYIVSAILFNDDGEILMMQEAKTSCYGLWYLPAGRMEPNETIEEAVQREVLEETGIKFRPSSLLCVEINSGFWYRFTLLGNATGGSLKTTEQKDKESLQAKWCSVDLIKSGRKGFPLRGGDILPLIDLAVSRRASENQPCDLLPAVNTHTALLLRILFIHTHPTSSETHMLLSKSPHAHLPVGLISTHDVSLQIGIYRILKGILGPGHLHMKILGVLALEHYGKPARLNDGLCLSILVSLEGKNQVLPPIPSQSYEWCPLPGDLGKEVLDRSQPGRLIPVLLLR